MQLGHAPLAQLDRVAHYECEGWGFESLMARQTETLIERWVFLFVCISIKGTRTQCSICFCESLYFKLCFQIVVIYNILILN